MRRDVIFNENSFGASSQTASLDLVNAATYVELLFPTLLLQVILWLDETKTLKHALNAENPKPVPNQPNARDCDIASDLSDISDKSDKETDTTILSVPTITLAMSVLPV